jgi:Ca2+-binding EF-hand superfamily protein
VGVAEVALYETCLELIGGQNEVCSLNYNMTELGNYHENEFWRTKLQRFMETRDANKDGHIERADFKLIIQRYKELGASEEHLKKINNAFGQFYDHLGIVDDSVSLTYDNYAARFAKMMREDSVEMNKIGGNLTLTMFEAIKANDSNEMSFKDWVLYYKAIGIDTAHARASFDAMDTNGDGVVSAEEFNNYNIEFFMSTEDTLNSSIL